MKASKNTEEKLNFRLNKYIAHSGICSRRKADEFIAAGQVTVNGKVIKEMGYKVESDDIIKFQGKIVQPEKKYYVLLNKPKDFICTTSDEKGRRTVMDLVKSATQERLYPVGRLDRNTTGLLLLTNDGELAQKLSHPSSKIKKIYHIVLDKPLAENDFKKIIAGLELEDGSASVDELAYVDPKDATQIGMEIHIGKNRIVRRIFEHLRYDVKKLDRVLYAGLTKKNLPRGQWRFLSQKELFWLKSLAKHPTRTH